MTLQSACLKQITAKKLDMQIGLQLNNSYFIPQQEVGHL